MKKVKYLIIGAGLSGLTLANFLKQNYLIVEKDNSVGGYCKTIKKGDFIWDYAGHFYHFKTDEFKNMFQELMKDEEIINNKKYTNILYNGNKIDYPFQTNIHQLEKNEFIDCLYDLFNKDEKEDYDNFLDMLYGKFGKSIVEKFLKPYNEKLYATDLSKLDVKAMGRFFPYADKEAIIKNMKKTEMSSYNDTFLYPKNGAQSFINVIYESIDKDKVLLKTEVVELDVDKKIAKMNSGESYEYEYLINTSPLNQFLKMSGLNDELLNNLSYNKVLVFNMGFNKKSINFKKEHWSYIPDKSINFYRIGFYDNILNGDKLSIYIEIGYSKDDIVDIETQKELTLQSLKKLGIIDDSVELEEMEAIIMDPAYVHITSETTNQINIMFEELKKKNIYCLGRYGSWTYCSMEDCMIEAKKIYESIK